MAKDSKPTVDEIKEQVTKCETIYGALWTNFEEDEKFYDLDFKNRLNIPKQFADDRIVLPTARDVVDVAVNHTDINNARVFANKKGTSNISIDSAEMLRKLGLGIIHATNVGAKHAPGHIGAKHYWIHGLAVFKTIYDADRWIDKPLRKEGESESAYAERLDEWRAETHLSVPIVIQAVHPACIMPDPTTGGELYVIERHKKSVFDAQRTLLYHNWTNPAGKGIEEEIEVISFWTKHYRCELIDGEPVWKIGGGVIEHKYGFNPYTLIESGLGNLAKDAAPEKRYVGLLRCITDLLISESINYTLCNILMKRETLKGGYATGENAAAAADIKQEYGFYPALPEGVELHDWETKMAPQEAYVHLGLTHDYIAGHAAPRSVRGLSETGVRSGADRRLVMAEAAAIYRYASPAFANGWANILTKCAMLVKNVIPGDFEIWAKTPTDEFDIEIKKSLMREPFNYYVEFAPISEEDEYRRHVDLTNLTSAGIVTKEFARRQMSNVDPVAMAKEEEKERLRNDPLYLQLKSQYLTGRMAQAISKREGAETLASGEVLPGIGAPQPTPTPGGSPGGRLVPPIPERAPLGSAQDLENKLRALTQPKPTLGRQGQGGGGSVQ